PPSPTPFPYTTLFRSLAQEAVVARSVDLRRSEVLQERHVPADRLPRLVVEETSAERRRPAVREAIRDLAEDRLLLEPDARELPRSEEHTSELQSREKL